MKRSTRRHMAARGMSLVEILVTIFVLVVGLLAVIRVLIPGLAALPATEDAGRGRALAGHVARKVEAKPELRMDAIGHGVRLGAAAADGWQLLHDVSMGDIDQLLLRQCTTANLVPLYPNVVIGERFLPPTPGLVRLVDCGPYIPGSLRVYYPEPYREVAPGQEDDGLPTNARTFSVTNGVVALDNWTGLNLVPAFMACYTVDGTPPGDIVGEVIVPVGNTLQLRFASIPYSVSLYELAPGITDNGQTPASGDDARAGALRAMPGVPVGTTLSCLYEMKPHVRSGWDDATITRFPEGRELRNIPCPDILGFDTYVPVNPTPDQYRPANAPAGPTVAVRTIKLPFEAIASFSSDGQPVPLDDTGPENIRLANALTGAIGTTANGVVYDEPRSSDPPAAPGDGVTGFGGYVRILNNAPGFPPGTPIRVYYRVAGNWSLERHTAAASYAEFIPGAPSQFSPTASGLKQYWYVRTVNNGLTTLVVQGSVPQRCEDYLGLLPAAPPVPYPGPMCDSDGHRIAVDYRYSVVVNGQTQIQRVVGETHLVDFTSHAFTLNNPSVVQIDAVRGISFKARACYEGSRGKRLHVDVDTLAMR